MITQEEWMDLLSYRSLAASGATWAEIACLAGCDWCTARKYLTKERPASVTRRRAFLRASGKRSSAVQ